MRGIEFMLNDKSLVSFALVSSTWQKYNKDSIDMIIPFVEYYFSEAYKIDEKSIVSIFDTKQYLADEFGLKIMSNVIEAIFKRLSKAPYFILSRDKNNFYLLEKQIDINEFKRQRDNNKISQQLVINEFYSFLDKKEIKYDQDVANDSLIKYLCRYGKDIIIENIPSVESGDVWNFRVGEFVQKMFESNTTISQYIQNIAKGGMISSIIFTNTQKTPTNKKFRNTEIYYDTPLLLHLLGYSGRAHQDSIKELTKLLLEQGATICYFEHNLRELKGILNAYITLYNCGKLNASYNFDYFIENSIKPEIVSEYIVLLERNLNKENLHLKDTPDYHDQQKVIDFVKFDKYLSEKIRYNNPDRRDNDISSLAAIYRLRKFDRYDKYETCNALFVATNTSLVYHAQRYFNIEEEKQGVPVIVDDTFLTVLAWLKSGSENEELPTLKIVADALASQTLSNEFWNCFLERVNEYVDKDIITEEDAISLKIDIFTKKNIYDITDGDTDKLDHSTMLELLKRNEIRKHEELLDLNSALSIDNEAKDDKINQLSQQIIKSKSDQYISNIKLWHFIKFIGKHWLFFLCIIIVIFSKVIDYILICNTLFRGSVLFSTLAVLLNKMFDKKISSYTNSISNWFYQMSFTLLINDIKQKDNIYSHDIIYEIKNRIKEFENIAI